MEFKEGQQFICSGCGGASGVLRKVVYKESHQTTKYWYIECGCNARTSYYENPDKLIIREFKKAVAFVEHPDAHKQFTLVEEKAIKIIEGNGMARICNVISKNAKSNKKYWEPNIPEAIHFLVENNEIF